MKKLVVLLGLITATLLLGVAAVNVRIRVYNATNKMEITGQPFTLGTRVLLTCNVTGLPNGSEAYSYRWYHNCPNRDNSCEIQNGHSYSVMKDTLLMNVTSWNQRGWYSCSVWYQDRTHPKQVVGFAPLISVAGGTRTLTSPTPVVTSEASPPTSVDSRESPTSTSTVSRPSPTSTLVANRASPTSTLVANRASPTSTSMVSRPRPTSTLVANRASPTSTPVVSRVATSTPVVNITPPTVSTTTTASITGNSSHTPNGQQNFSRNPFNTHPLGTFIGVGVGAGMLLLLVLLTLVAVLILVVVVVKRKATTKQKRDTTVEDDPYYNTAIVMQETEMTEQGMGNDYHYALNHTGEEEDPFNDGFNPYEVVDRRVHSKNTMTPMPKESSTPTSAMNGPAVYAAVGKSKKNGPKETGDVFSITHKEDQYAMPIKKEGKLTDKGEAVVRSGGVEEEEQYDDMVR